MSLPRYPEYRDSGVEWLGEVPESWSIFSIKRSVDGCTNGLWGDDPDGDNDLVVIRVADFDRSASRVGLEKLTYRSVTQKERASRILEAGDLLIEKSGGGERTLVGCVVLFLHDFPAITSNFVARMRPYEGFDSRFLCYAFDTLYQGKVNYPAIKQTTGIQNLDSEAYLQERFCFPPRSEQEQIARFLDHETAKIDALIQEQQRLIELLKEKRQAVISHAVTKGLDPSVPMKDSGVEWLGEVPEHWQVNKASHLGRLFGSDGAIEEMVVEEGNLPFLKVGSLSVGGIEVKSWDWFIDVSVESRFHPCDHFVVFPKRGAAIFLNKVNVVNRKALIDPNLMGWELFRPNSTKYFAHALKCRDLSDLADISTVPQINNKHIAPVYFPVPPALEQLRIVEYLNHEVQKLEILMQQASLGVGLLTERRSALISAAVTGKIDVRNWKPPADESAFDEEVRQAGLEAAL